MNQYINPSMKIFSHMDRLHEIRYGGRPAPVNVELDLSNRCSRGCFFCHFAYTHTRGPLKGKRDKPQDAIDGGDLMDLSLARSVVEQIREAGVKSLTFTGGGEPTLHPQFNEIANHAANEGLELGLYTLGGHIDTERAALLRKRMTWVYVSLDECTPETYQRTKGMDGFQSVINGIRRLVAAEGKATIGVGFLLHTDNCDQVGDMVTLGKALGVDYVQFRPAIHYSQEAPAQQVDDVQWINRAINNLRQFAGDPFVIADVGRFEQYRDWTAHGYSTCYWSALQTVITPNGKVWRCTNKREHASALLGDLAQESFAELWARSGGPCQVDGQCRVMCKGHTGGNITLNAIMEPSPHVNFI